MHNCSNLGAARPRHTPHHPPAHAALTLVDGHVGLELHDVLGPPHVQRPCCFGGCVCVRARVDRRGRLERGRAAAAFGGRVSAPAAASEDAKGFDARYPGTATHIIGRTRISQPVACRQTAQDGPPADAPFESGGSGLADPPCMDAQRMATVEGILLFIFKSTDLSIWNESGSNPGPEQPTQVTGLL